ncbi:MAG: glycosyltransferase family 1 protein [Chitinophagia bacterium]|nr:glycosyltransferase family 1 protein [Chitinophagia bacterium]
MRIGVNTRLLLKGKLEGIGWFTNQTLERIVRQHPEHEFYFFFDRAYDHSFLFASNVIPVVVSPPARHPTLFYLWFEWALPIKLKKYKIDIFLSTDSYLSLKTKIPTCLVVHDLAFEHYPEHYVPSQRFYWRHFSPLFAQKATHIATVSSFTKQDLVERYGIAPGKIDVVYNGAHPLYRPLSHEERNEVKQQYTQGCEYFVFAGAIHPRKNILNLLQAFVAFKKHQRTQMKLVIVGRNAWKYAEVEAMKATMPFKDDVIWVGYLNVDKLCKVMGAAYALVYASLFEGFGIPILEAMQCDVPVIASNTSSMPEVTGDAGLLVNPNDVADIAGQMHLMYKDEALRSRLIVKAREQVKKFSWDATAAKLWDCIMKCK